MTTPRFDREQIHAGVREDLSTCLAVEPDDVTLETNFFYDLDGESIDVLDFGFRCERRLGIRSPFTRLTAPEAWQFDDKGQISEQSLQALHAEFPQIDWKTRLGAKPMQSYKDAVTIGLMVEVLYFAQFAEATPPSASPA